MQLADVSKQDAPAKVLAEQIISNPGQSPIPFDLSYDPDAIVPSHSYAVQARIEWEGKLLLRQRHAPLRDHARVAPRS